MHLTMAAGVSNFTFTFLSILAGVLLSGEHWKCEQMLLLVVASAFSVMPSSGSHPACMVLLGWLVKLASYTRSVPYGY